MKHKNTCLTANLTSLKKLGFFFGTEVYKTDESFDRYHSNIWKIFCALPFNLETFDTECVFF